MILLLLILLGLAFGSFVNALVWRLHKNRDWVQERSECTHCHHQLGAWDLIPVISWVMLRGKCRYCHKKIEDSPLVELSLPLLFAVSYIFWPLSFEGPHLFQFILWLVFLVGFLALTVYDLRWMLLPDKIVFPLVGLAVLQILTLAIWQRDVAILLHALVGLVTVSGTFYILFQLSKGTWIGGGDVKLGLVLGLLAGGILEGFLLLFVASVAGMLAALPLIIQGKAHKKTQLPFGPFLILGLIVVTLWGHDIVSWYQGLIYV